MRGLRTASPNPTDPQGLHRPALRRQARQSDHLPQGILPEVGEGKFFRIESRSPFTGRRRRSRVTDAATVAAGGSATWSHLGRAHHRGGRLVVRQEGCSEGLQDHGLPVKGHR